MTELNESKSHPPRVGAIVLAAGQSRRMEGIDKLFFSLNGRPLIWYSILALTSHPLISEVSIVTSKANIAKTNDVVTSRALDACVRVCEGGDRRQDSVLKGLSRLHECEFVVVHDGARPFISSRMVTSGISMALKYDAAIAAVPVKDTIKDSDGNGLVTQTIPRDNLWAVQTPQVFRTTLLKEAHRRVRKSVTDDASMVEAIGHPVRLFLGSDHNIKVTTPEDLIIANAINEYYRCNESSGVK